MMILPQSVTLLGLTWTHTEDGTQSPSCWGGNLKSLSGEKKQTNTKKVPLVNPTEMVVIMRTDNTWVHVERITITDSNTREHKNTNFLTQTLVPHRLFRQNVNENFAS